jgi:hypothetical protein
MLGGRESMAGTLTELAIQSVRNSISCASIDQLTAMSPHDQNRYLAVREHLIHLAPQQKAPERAASM